MKTQSEAQRGNLSFYKYEGTGNDFILIDHRKQHLLLSSSLVAALCERRRGIGADGLILLESSEQHAFHMRYFNADGSSGVCANGARCAASLAQHLGIANTTCSFSAEDKIMQATQNAKGIALQWTEESHIGTHSDGYSLQIGGTHFVQRSTRVKSSTEVHRIGAALRYDKARFPEGANIHFVHIVDNELYMRSFEKGVEDETLSCGTGAVAVAIVAQKVGWIPQQSEVIIHTLGGPLQVQIKQNANGSQHIQLTGKVCYLYVGHCDLEAFASQVKRDLNKVLL